MNTSIFYLCNSVKINKNYIITNSEHNVKLKIYICCDQYNFDYCNEFAIKHNYVALLNVNFFERNDYFSELNIIINSDQYVNMQLFDGLYYYCDNYIIFAKNTYYELLDHTIFSNYDKMNFKHIIPYIQNLFEHFEIKSDGNNVSISINDISLVSEEKIIILKMPKVNVTNIDGIEVENYSNDYYFKDGIYYLLMIGEFDITHNHIFALKEDMISTNCNIMSPIICFNNKIEYCGAIIQNDVYYCLDNNITNGYKFDYVFDTMLPYYHLCMFRNVSNILNSFEDKKHIIEKITRASIITKSVKVNPITLNIKNKPKHDYTFTNNNYCISKDVIFDKQILRELFNMYNKHGLVSFKTYNDIYYLNYNHKKNILVMEYLKFTPNKDTGSKYLYNFMLALLQCGFNVIFYNCLNANNKYVNNLKKYGINVVSDIKFIKNNYNVFSYVMLSRTYAYKYYYEIIKKYCMSSKIIYIAHEIFEMKNILRDKCNINSIIDEKNKLIENEALNNCDNVIVVSEKEKEYLNNDCVWLIPICYNNMTNYHRDVTKTKHVYFVGCGQETNIHSLSYFITNKWINISKKRRDIHLIVIGDELKTNVNCDDYDNVTFVGHIIDEKYDNYIKQFRMNLVYLLYGGGSKGRIIEASSLKIPTIANDVALIGMNIDNVIINNFDEDYVDKFINTYDDICNLEKVSNAVYEEYCKKFNMDNCKKYITTYLS